MKKSILFSMMAAALLAGCSNEEATQVAEEGLVPIRLSMANADISVSPSTRGTGSIDGEDIGLEDDTLGFSSTDLLYITAYNSENPDFSEPMTVLIGGETYENLEDVSASVEDGTSTLGWNDNRVRYYLPEAASYDFYGCHLGLTEMERESSGLAFVQNEDSVYYSLTLDGNQDLMAAKSDRPGSASLARRGENPKLAFHHLLTRLQFQLTDGNPDGNQTDLTIKGIAIRSVATGKLVLATTGGVAPHFVLDAYDEINNPVVELPLQDIPEEGQAIAGANKTRIGGSLMVPAVDPSDNEYEVVLDIEEELNGQITTYELGNLPPIELPADPENGTYVGKSYMVNITLYGSQEVALTATLLDWEQGGDIEYDPEADI